MIGEDRTIPRILTIAGSDSGGGAGIQADLKTITVLGGFGMSVLTALTAQNTTAVKGIHEVPLDFIALQIDAVAEDIGVDAAKTGMLLSADIVELVADKVKEHGIRNLVVDPVMVAKSGDALLLAEAREAVKKALIPLSRVVTPNVPEAEILAGLEISDRGDMQEAARIIHGLGAENVVVKGGHMPRSPVDMLYDGRDFLDFEAVRYDTPHTHGTGCTFSAAIAAGLGHGHSVPEAVRQARSFIDLAIRHALPLGHGHGPTNHFAQIALERERRIMVEKLEEALGTLEDLKPAYLLPNVPADLVYALPRAASVGETASFPGGIVRYYDGISAFSPPDFGVSPFMGHLLPAMTALFPTIRAAINLKLVDGFVERAEKEGLSVHGIEWTEARGSGGALEIKFSPAVSDVPPDILRHEGGFALEPQMIVCGENPEEVVDKIVLMVEGG